MTNATRRMAIVGLLAIMTVTPVQADEFPAPTGDVLLTISGSITKTNAYGVLMLDQQQLSSLPQSQFTTSTPWTSGNHTFQGVLLKDLVAAIGATGKTINLTATNDYTVTMPVADIADDAPLLAYLMDGQTMSLRENGPVWMVYPYDAVAAYRSEETYNRSVWQLIRIEFVE